MGIFSKIFPSSNDRQLKKLEVIANKIEKLADKYSAYTDEELFNCTADFKERYKNGETLDQLLPEAFAVVREAATRVLGMRHYHVQLLGGIVLHQGRIAEMCTGEGKTLVSTLPAYLNALTGKGVHLVTVNDYLATRDAEWMGKVHRFLGLTVGVVVPGMDPDEKRQAYACDIVYGTNNELGFDYLRDNMAQDKNAMTQRELAFAIVDEVDSILIDEARTPLIISGRGGESTDLYMRANSFVRNLKAVPEEEVAERKGTGGKFERALKSAQKLVDENGEELDAEDDGYHGDYIVDEEENTVRLTTNGVKKAEMFFKLDNYSDPENFDINHHINQALKAHYTMKRDKDYIVNDQEIIIVDEFTGRLMIGRRYNEGLHQAIEAKEGVIIRNESKTYATITFQNYFRLYGKLSGMTGTAKTEETEFRNIYGLDVIQIPTNLPCQRIDEYDRLYKTVKGKYEALIADVSECHKKGQPVLIGTVSVEKSEELSKLLKKRGIRHNVLNAKNHQQEAMIIAQTGKVGAVTIATNMAGRGTDIMLGGNPEYLAKEDLAKKGFSAEVISEATSYAQDISPDGKKARELYEKYYASHKAETDKEKAEVIALGGLRIIGTERHESRRIDNQLRGRAGRQGDPGSSVFYISMQDDLARIFGGEMMQSVAERFNLPEDMPITIGVITKQIEKAQYKVEDRNYSVRKHVLAYDDVMNKHREVIYGERQKVLNGLDMHEQIIKYIPAVATQMVTSLVDFNVDIFHWDYRYINGELEKKLLPEGSNVVTTELAEQYEMDKIIDAVIDKAISSYEEKVAYAVANGIVFGNIERREMLRTVDKHWVEHIDAMDMLRKGIGLRSLGQQDPVMSYRNEGNEMFDDMIDSIQTEVVTRLLKFDVDRLLSVIKGATPAPKVESVYPNELMVTGSGTAVRKEVKVGRNDPCPCGSGKKYKLCCGK